MIFHKTVNEIIRKNNKNIRKTLLLFGFPILYFISSIPVYACDMMALISLSGYTISEQTEIPGDFNDPFDFYEFMKEWSDSLTNDDGYGILYYKDGEVLIDSTQKWYKIGNGSWYGDGSDEPLDTAINEIMDENNNAVIILGHVREAGTGYGNHPFTFELQNTTYTMMHNGWLGNSIKSALMTCLGEDWFIHNPSNWEGQYGNVNSFIDSELLFHFIMKHVISCDMNVIAGIYFALNSTDVQGYNLRELFSNGTYTINFILSDGEFLYVFRNSHINGNDHNLSYEMYNNEFIGVKTQDSLSNQILPNTLVIIPREREIRYIDFYNPQFSAEPNNGYVPLEVNFIDESNGNPTSWQWDFQNDGIYDSFQQNPTFIYNNPGIYDVKLKISDSTFVDSLVKFNCITVSDIPPVYFTPDSFYFFLEQGVSNSDILTISNTGPSNFIFSIEKDYPFKRDSGGPDEFGYLWKDSDEPVGSEYDWIDISEVGTQLSFVHNDYAVGTFDIGFDFDFYGTTYDECIISPNGWIGFGDDWTNYLNYSIPRVDAPRPAIFGFWDDLDPIQGGNVYYYTNGIDSLIVWFDHVIHYPGVNNGTYDFEMILTSDGRIKFQYRTVTGDINTSTIGIQNERGRIGLQVAYNEDYVHDSLAVEIVKQIDWVTVDPDDGIVLPNDRQDIEVTVFKDELDYGEYLCNLQITANDQENHFVTIPVILNIESIVLYPPENVIISYDFDSIIISWESVTNATSYKVYSSDNPYSGFYEDFSGIYDGTTWTSQYIDEKRFYRVTAIKQD